MSKRKSKPEADAAVQAAQFSGGTITTEKKVRAIQARRQGATWREVGKAVPCSTTTITEWKYADPVFAEGWDKASLACLGRLEDVLEVCAGKAKSDPRYQTSLIFAMKNHPSGAYREAYDITHRGTLQFSFPDLAAAGAEGAEAVAKRAVGFVGRKESDGG